MDGELYYLNGLGAAGGSPAQLDLNAFGLRSTQVYYPGDIGAWVSSGRYGADEIPSDSDVQTACALCTTGFIILDIEHWDHATEYQKYIDTLTKFQTYKPAGALVGGYHLGLNGYIAIVRCTSPHGDPSAAYNLFKADNDEAAVYNDYVDMYCPAFYLEKAAPTVPDDFNTTAQCFLSERSRLGLSDSKPIVPFIWPYYSDINDAATANVSGATNANPIVVTVDTAIASLISGNTVHFSQMSGMTELNNKTFIAEKLTSTTYTLKNPTTSAFIDSSAYGTYTANGFMSKVADMDEWEAQLKACKQYLDGFIFWSNSYQQPTNMAAASLRAEPYMKMVAKYANRVTAKWR